MTDKGKDKEDTNCQYQEWNRTLLQTITKLVRDYYEQLYIQNFNYLAEMDQFLRGIGEACDEPSPPIHKSRPWGLPGGPGLPPPPNISNQTSFRTTLAYSKNRPSRESRLFPLPSGTAATFRSTPRPSPSIVRGSHVESSNKAPSQPGCPAGSWNSHMLSNKRESFPSQISLEDKWEIWTSSSTWQ